MVTPFSLIILDEKTMFPNATASCFIAVSPIAYSSYSDSYCSCSRRRSSRPRGASAY